MPDREGVFKRILPRTSFPETPTARRAVGRVGLILVLFRHSPGLVLTPDQLSEQKFVDAAVVHVDDLDLEAAELEDLAFVRDAGELVKNKAGDGVEAFLRVEILAQHVRQFAEVGLAVDQP